MTIENNGTISASKDIQHFMLFRCAFLINGLTSTSGDDQLILKVNFRETATSLFVEQIHVCFAEGMICYPEQNITNFLDFPTVSDNIYKIICNEKSRQHWDKDEFWWEEFHKEPEGSKPTPPNSPRVA